MRNKILKQFDEKFTRIDKTNGKFKENWFIKEVLSEDVKTFIEKALLEVKRETEKELDIKIGQLRQWLNEERITDPKKMVTNEDLKTFLK